MKLKKKMCVPLRYSIQLCTVSAGSVSLICFSASSSKTSPVGLEDFKRTLRFRRLRLRMPAFSNSSLPRRASSIKMQPRKPDEMQSFQNDVYP